MGHDGAEGVSTRVAIVCAHLGFPLGNGLTPIVLFRWPGKRHRSVQEHCAAAFDFQMTYAVGGLLVLLALVMLAQLTTQTLMLAVVFGIVGLAIFEAFFALRAAVDGWRGRPARYPPSVQLMRRELR